MQIIKAGAKRRSSKKFTDKETITAKICVAFAFYKEVFFYKKFFVYKGGSSKRSQSSKRAYSSGRVSPSKRLSCSKRNVFARIKVFWPENYERLFAKKLTILFPAYHFPAYHLQIYRLRPLPPLSCLRSCFHRLLLKRKFCRLIFRSRSFAKPVPKARI